MVEGGGMIRQVEETENKQKTKDTDRKWRRTKSDHTRGTDSTERQTRPNICIELLRHLTYRSLTKAPNMCSVTSANRKAMFNIFGLIVGHSFHLVRRCFHVHHRGKKWSNKHHAGVCLQLRYWWCECVCVWPSCTSSLTQTQAHLVIKHSANIHHLIHQISKISLPFPPLKSQLLSKENPLILRVTLNVTKL